MHIGIIDFSTQYKEKLESHLLSFCEIGGVITGSDIDDFIIKTKKVKAISLILIHGRAIKTTPFRKLQKFKNNFRSSRIVVIHIESELKINSDLIQHKLIFHDINVLSDEHLLKLIEDIKDKIKRLSLELLFTMLKNENKKSIRSFSTISSNLTNRELEVMKYLLRGMTYNEIAHSLQISPHTVNDHIKKIYHKLNINSKGELMSIYMMRSPE